MTMDNGLQQGASNPIKQSSNSRYQANRAQRKGWKWLKSMKSKTQISKSWGVEDLSSYKRCAHVCVKQTQVLTFKTKQSQCPLYILISHQLWSTDHNLSTPKKSFQDKTTIKTKKTKSEKLWSMFFKGLLQKDIKLKQSAWFQSEHLSCQELTVQHKHQHGGME